MNNQEIECRFLEIDVPALKNRLAELGAKDLGEDLFSEMIFYSRDPKQDLYHTPIIKIRQTKKGIEMTYKHHLTESADGTVEITVKVSDAAKARELLEELGLEMFRRQEKKRHSFKLGDVFFDIDTWPKIPTYVELEGGSEQALRDAAQAANLDWKNVVFDNPLMVMEKRYHIPVRSYRYFTFDKMG